MKKAATKSVDEHIAAQLEALRSKLERVRASIKKAVPEAVEGIGYGMPGYKLNGKAILFSQDSVITIPYLGHRVRSWSRLKKSSRVLSSEKAPSGFHRQTCSVKLISRIARLRAEGISASEKKVETPRAKRIRKIRRAGTASLKQRS